MAQARPLVYVCSDSEDSRRALFLQTLRTAGVRLFEAKPAPLGVRTPVWRREQMELGLKASNIVIMLSTASSGWVPEELRVIESKLKAGTVRVIPVMLGNPVRILMPSWAQELEGVLVDAQPPYGESFDRLLGYLHVPGFDSAAQQAGSDYYLRCIQIADNRCFKQCQQLRLFVNSEAFARWTVILGDNGVGKTTLLRSIAHFGHARPSEPLPERAELAVELATSPQLRITSTEIEHSQILPAVYGYGAGRGVHTARLAPNSIHPTATLFDDSAALPDAEEWWLQSDYAWRVSKEETSFARLERVKAALVELLPDVTDISVQPDKDKQPRLMARTVHGDVLLRDLSLGYNTALTWVIDFARRLFERYPNAPDPLAEPAVLLVDEIDLHLHPRWQRELLQTLDRIFKKTQFIVTAHSPLIVQAAPNANLALLRWDGDQVVIDNDVDYIRKWRVDQILASELFGEQPTHAPEVEDLIEKKVALASKADLTAEEQVELQQLDDELAHLPTAANPSDFEAMRLIRDAAEALKARSRQ